MATLSPTDGKILRNQPEPVSVLPEQFPFYLSVMLSVSISMGFLNVERRGDKEVCEYSAFFKFSLISRLFQFRTNWFSLLTSCSSADLKLKVIVAFETS